MSMSDIMSPLFTVLFTVPYLGNLFAAQLKRARRSGSVKHPAVSPWKEASKYDLSNVVPKCDTGCLCLTQACAMELLCLWSRPETATATRSLLTKRT